jgi:hypothetical protein
MTLKLILALASCLTICNCGALLLSNSPKSSRYLKSEGGGMMMDAKSNKPFTYTYDFSVKSSAPINTYATIQYESPDGSKIPSTNKDKVQPGQRISITSASFGRIKNNAYYNVTVSLYNDPGRKNLIDSLNQPLRFSMPRNALAAFGLSSKVD